MWCQLFQWVLCGFCCRKKKSTVVSEASSDEEHSATGENVKVVTKGALKVFEGVKVSIPTEDLDLTKVLSKKPAGETEEQQPEVENARKPARNGLKKVASALICKTKPSQKLSNQKDDDKNYDVYDFEETQDNSDVFFANPLTNYRSFRSQIETNTKETETSSLTDTFSFEAVSVSSTSTLSNVSAKKTKVDKNATKKKCMIMGRIFKNALKSKVDDNIREIPEVNNEKLVNDYVLNCPHPEPPKVTMTQEEMDRLFNDLLEGTETKNNKTNKTKQQTQKLAQPKKRNRKNSETTDDEFSIGKPVKKRTYKKSSDKKVDNSINLEQELKECIGVASRKSQRKCTSGKQNVLVEFWSSDESISEAVLETTPIRESPPIVEKINEQQTQNILPEPPVTKPQRRPKKHLSKNKPKLKTKESEKLKPTEPIVETLAINRRKRASVNTLYYWSSSSEDEFNDLIEVKSVRDEFHDDEDRPMQHGWIVGDSPKKLVTMLAQAKGKKSDLESVKEQAKNRTSIMCS